jgi:hypothetical protein
MIKALKGYKGAGQGRPEVTFQINHCLCLQHDMPAAARAILHSRCADTTAHDASAADCTHSGPHCYQGTLRYITQQLIKKLVSQGNPFDEESPNSEDLEMEEDPELDPPPAAKAKQKLKTVIQTIKASSISASAALHAVITSTTLSVSVLPLSWQLQQLHVVCGSTEGQPGAGLLHPCPPSSRRYAVVLASA